MPKAETEGFAIALGARLDIPDDAVPTIGRTASAVVSSTPVTVIAATAGKTLYITEVCAVNGATDAADLHVQSITSNTVILSLHLGVSQGHTHRFDPPVAIEAGEGLEALSNSTGDTKVIARGWLGT